MAHQPVRHPADAELPEVHDVARQGTGLVAEYVGHLQAGRQQQQRKRKKRGKQFGNPEQCRWRCGTPASKQRRKLTAREKIILPKTKRGSARN